MDVLAHALWTGAASKVVAHRRKLTRREVGAMLFLGVAPDVIQLMPVLAWSLVQPDSLHVVHSFVAATPGREPALPSNVALLTHHLHCFMHSMVIAATVGLLLRRILGYWWLPLTGWWLHILIDIPTHSNDYYAVPLLYPFTYRGFDGIAWIDPRFMVANYAAIAITYAILLRPRGSLS